MEIYNILTHYNILLYEFSLKSISRDFTKDNQREIFLNGTVYDFSVNYKAMKKEDTLNIHEYLIKKNTHYIIFRFLNKYLSYY